MNRSIRNWILEQEKMVTIYHITTLENFDKIKSSGGLDPKKTVNGRTLFSLSKKEALSILPGAFWMVRETKGYILLIFRIPESWVLKDKRIEQGSTGKFISLDYLINTEIVSKVEPDIVKRYVSQKDNLDIMVIKNKNNPSFKYKVFSKNLDRADLNQIVFPKNFVQGIDYENWLNDGNLDEFESVLLKRGYRKL